MTGKEQERETWGRRSINWNLLALSSLIRCGEIPLSFTLNGYYAFNRQSL
jgi:hypothetical protein